MSSVVTKVGLIVGGIATVSGLGSAIYFSTLTTIEQKILSEGLELIKNDEDYKFILFNKDNTEGLKKALSKDSFDLNTDGPAVKKWCESNLKQWLPNDELLKNAKAWCTLPTIKTLRDKLTGKANTAETWKSNFTKLASSPSSKNPLLAALNAIKPDPQLTSASENGGVKLKEWCESALNQKVYEVAKEHMTEANIQEWCFHKG